MIVIVLFIYGLFIGSFLNVVIDRLPWGKSLGGRSYCDHCKKKIAWYDLVPVFSLIVLGGKCRFCKKKISWQYPLVELLTGIVFIVVYVSMYRYVNSDNFPVLLVLQLIIYSGLIAIFFIDFKNRIIPDEILVVLLGATLVTKFITGSPALLVDLLCGGVLFLIFMALVLLTKGKGMGLGDVKYVFYMGLFLGYPASVVAFYVAFLTGAFISLILVFRGEKRFGQTIAFGPFLVIATVVSHIFGAQLWLYFIKILGYG